LLESAAVHEGKTDAKLVAVDLAKSYRLLNHGPTVLVSSAHDGQQNVMAAAWAMPLDFDPPKVLVVVDKATHTRN
jgi:flavin reductase (DIM6/NTAB) family NADH-FMN oxidoreductase RutF